MQFLKILFWCLIAFLAAVFTLGNWTWVDIRLWGGLVATTNLPLLLLAAFLAGFAPTLVYQHWVRWRMRQRIQSLERQLETLRALSAAPLPLRPLPPLPPTQPEPPIAADLEGATLPGAPPP